MTRIFEVTTTCPNTNRDGKPVSSTYRVSAIDAEKAIAKAKKSSNWAVPYERVMSVILLASTD